MKLASNSKDGGLQASSSLQLSEWVLFIVLVGFIGSLFLISTITSSHHLEKIHTRGSSSLPVELCSIEIQGCVKKPGIYQVPRGTTVRVALRKACPQRFADLSSVNLNQLITQSCQIHLLSLAQIQIHLIGAVKQQADLYLPVGSRICDLKEKIELTAEADLAFFKRKRLLKNGETVFVPSLLKQGR